MAVYQEMLGHLSKEVRAEISQSITESSSQKHKHPIDTKADGPPSIKKSSTSMTRQLDTQGKFFFKLVVCDGNGGGGSTSSILRKKLRSILGDVSKVCPSPSKFTLLELAEMRAQTAPKREG